VNSSSPFFLFKLMANHVLSLEVPNVSNACIMTIMDTSVYSDIIPVLCPTLDITAPGFTSPSQINVEAGFIKTVSACDLGLQTVDCGTTYVDIPDGVYIIRYSVAPNDIVYVEYNHLRITKALDIYNKVLCTLDISSCDPTVKVKERLQELRMIRMYLDAAKAKVEYCGEPDKGMTIYNYALKLLNKMNCINC
jgi:hypothetical protein